MASRSDDFRPGRSQSELASTGLAFRGYRKNGDPPWRADAPCRTDFLSSCFRRQRLFPSGRMNRTAQPPEGRLDEKVADLARVVDHRSVHRDVERQLALRRDGRVLAEKPRRMSRETAGSVIEAYAERATGIARSPSLDDAREGRDRCRTRWEAPSPGSSRRARALSHALVGEHEQPLRRQVHRAVAEQAPVVHPPHAAAEADRPAHLAAAVHRQLSARRARQRRREQTGAIGRAARRPPSVPSREVDGARSRTWASAAWERWMASSAWECGLLAANRNESGIRRAKFAVSS